LPDIYILEEKSLDLEDKRVYDSVLLMFYARREKRGIRKKEKKELCFSI
jgi:hypothetical protein